MMVTHFPFLTLTPTLVIVLLLTTLPQSYSQKNDAYSICSQQFSCGTLTNISYPFWGGNRPQFCGSDGFKLTCMHNQNASFQVGSQNFHVLGINQTASTMRVVRTDLVYDHCSSNFTNTSLSGTPFSILPTVQSVTIFYDCPSSGNSSTVGNSLNFTCQNDSSAKHGFYAVNGTQLQQFRNCRVSVQVQVSRGALVWDSENNGDEALKKALDQGFDVKYDEEWSSQCTACVESGGVCGTNKNGSSQFSCYCPGGTHDSPCPAHKSRTKHKVLKLVLGFVATGLGLPLIAVTICRNKAKIWKFIKTQFGKIRNDRHIEAFLESQGTLGIKRYSFSDVRKMTDSFKVKLGQGGYGSVYKGKLPSGGSVAVKILNESKSNGEEFINEVASISKTSHVNVVTLVGFCLDGSRKALIYEFMSNGSLEKFIHRKKDAAETSPSLSWDKLYQIAVGIARGLEYLHKGCNTRILHFDIKPHNILLDENYRPKISDFGLAKLSTRDESIVSMSDARGTVGYLAPEMCNKSFGGVSHKSDVYSYGMMLLEMVGGQKNSDIEASRSSESEIYFPHLVIYKKLEVGSDLGLDGGNNELAKRMTMVGLWCIQTIPAHRPTISKVIEMLEGSMDSLEMPPKPVMSSPPRSTTEFSTASLSTDSLSVPSV